MKNRFKLFALIITLVAALAFPSVASFALSIVAPSNDYYLDNADVLSADTKDYITKRNYNLETNCKGAQICVVILKSIGAADVEEYSYELFNRWGIGRKDEDNGVLLLVVVGNSSAESKYWIVPGTGLETLLDTGALKTIAEKYYEPNAEKGDLDKAVRETFRMLNYFICSSYAADPDGYAASNSAGGSGYISGGGKNSNARKGSSCTSFNSPVGVAENASCSSCIGCNSCRGIGGLLLLLAGIYIVLEIFRYLGRSSASRAARGYSQSSGGYAPHRTSYYRSGGSFWRAFKTEVLLRCFLNLIRRSSSSNRSPFSSFGGGKTSGGAGRSSFSGFRGGGGTTRGGGFGSFGSGFRSGGGSSRGGGFGRK